MPPEEPTTNAAETLVKLPASGDGAKPARRRKSQQQAPDAETLEATRSQLLAVAGLSVREQGEILRQAVDVARSKLLATRVQRLVRRVSRDAEEIVEFTDVDHATQQKAVTQLFDLLGANASTKSQPSGPSGPREIVLHFADMPAPTKIEVIEIQAKPA